MLCCAGSFAPLCAVTDHMAGWWWWWWWWLWLCCSELSLLMRARMLSPPMAWEEICRQLRRTSASVQQRHRLEYLALTDAQKDEWIAKAKADPPKHGAEPVPYDVIKHKKRSRSLSYTLAMGGGGTAGYMPPPPPSKPMIDWTVGDVGQWLRSIAMPYVQYVEAFAGLVSSPLHSTPTVLRSELC